MAEDWFRVAVKAVLFYEGNDPQYRNKLLILIRSKGNRGGYGTFPGGRLKMIDGEPETPDAGLLREVMEETGIELKINSILDVSPVPYVGNSPTYRITFLCTTSSNEVILNHEHSGYKWLTLEEALSLPNQDDLDYIALKKLSVS